LSMNPKSEKQDLLFCGNPSCRVITFVPIPNVLSPSCPGCLRSGLRVRGPVDETNFRARFAAIRQEPPTPETATSPVVRGEDSPELGREEG
jgi:hypothetical protein